MRDLAKKLNLFFRVLTNAVASYEYLVQLSFFKKAEKQTFEVLTNACFYMIL